MPLFGKNKIDAVVVGVRYQNDGRIDWVRAYERRGPTWSDWKLFKRQDLFTRLQAGEKWVAGERLQFQGGTFETGEPLRVVRAGGSDVVVVGPDRDRDELAGVPQV